MQFIYTQQSFILYINCVSLEQKQTKDSPKSFYLKKKTDRKMVLLDIQKCYKFIVQKNYIY